MVRKASFITSNRFLLIPHKPLCLTYWWAAYGFAMDEHALRIQDVYWYQKRWTTPFQLKRKMMAAINAGVGVGNVKLSNHREPITARPAKGICSGHSLSVVAAPDSHYRRDILKMDHHCVWTCNCVSHRTFPHFIRFLFYAVASMSYLQYFLYLRAAVVWKNRNLPSVRIMTSSLSNG